VTICSSSNSSSLDDWLLYSMVNIYYNCKFWKNQQNTSSTMYCTLCTVTIAVFNFYRYCNKGST
jgi:hypothetical protein